jgi:hypothetical protein
MLQEEAQLSGPQVHRVKRVFGALCLSHFFRDASADAGMLFDVCDIYHFLAVDTQDAELNGFKVAERQRTLARRGRRQQVKGRC